MASTQQRLARLRQLQPAFIKWEALRDKQLPAARQHISELARKLETESAVVSDLQEELDELERQLQVLVHNSSILLLPPCQPWSLLACMTQKVGFALLQYC